MSARPHCPGTFFCHARGTPVTRYLVMLVFSMLIAKLGLDTKRYKTHSFRIGAATNAWVQGRSSSFGANLQLHRLNASVFGQGKGGMRWKQVCPKVRSLLEVEDPPHYLLVHCRGNDIGQEDKCVVLRENIKKGLDKLQNLLPNTTLIWSQVLPRLQWRGEVDHLALERARVRLNSCIATYILELQSKYIRYLEL